MPCLSQSSHPSDEIRASSQNSDIVWSGDFWMCKQQLKHYPAYFRNGISISVYFFVWIMEAESKAAIGYVEDLFEDQQGEKLARVRQFLNPEEVKSRFPEVCPQSREVFITATEQVISPRCIDSVVAVLTPAHFKKCEEFLPQSLSFKSFMCHREIRNNSVSTFTLSKMRGYLTQPILHALKCTVLGPRFEEADGSGPADPVTAPRSNFTAGPKDQAGECGATRQRLQREVLPRDLAGDCAVPVEQIQGNVEILSQDSGIRGCWFRCKILQSSKKRILVQYCDAEHLEESRKLEEWIPAHRVAAPDKLGIRCTGRLTVRPWPETGPTNDRLEVGTPVDAWWCDGWWEGVLLGYDTENNLQVYFPGENQFMTVGRKDIRISKDWVENKWIDISPKPNILSLLTSSFNPSMKAVPLPSLPHADGTAAGAGEGKATTSSGARGCQHEKPCSASHGKKVVEDPQLKGRLSVKEIGKSSSDKSVRENEDGSVQKSSSATAGRNVEEGNGQKSSSATADRNVEASTTADQNVEEGNGQKSSSANADRNVEEGSSSATAGKNVEKTEECSGKRSSTGTGRKNVGRVREIVHALPAVCSKTGKFLQPHFPVFKSTRGRNKSK